MFKKVMPYIIGQVVITASLIALGYGALVYCGW
jgi:hypothetical protein